MKKTTRFGALLLAVLLLLQLCACNDAPKKKTEEGAVPCPIEGLSWGMTKEDALKALPKGCTVEQEYTTDFSTVVSIAGCKEAMFGLSPDGDNAFLKLSFYQPMSYKDRPLEPMLEEITIKAPCADFEALQKSVTDAMGEPAKSYEGSYAPGGPGPGSPGSAPALLWLPTGKGMQAYPEEVECLVAAMHRRYFGKNLADGTDIFSLKSLEDLGELDLHDIETVRKDENYTMLRDGRMGLFNYTASTGDMKGTAVLVANGGMVSLAETAETLLKNK